MLVAIICGGINRFVYYRQFSVIIPVENGNFELISLSEIGDYQGVKKTVVILLKIVRGKGRVWEGLGVGFHTGEGMSG